MEVSATFLDRLLFSRWLQAWTPLSFVTGCALIYGALALAIPSYFPLIDADSGGYIDFARNRTAFYPLLLRFLARLGLGLHQVAYVQLVLFALALTVLLLALLRIGVPRSLVLLFTLALALNGYFSALAFTIMTESLCSTVAVLAIAFWLDYFRTGRVGFLALTGLCVGLSIGIRPASFALLPMVFVSAWVCWHRRNASKTIFAAALIVPIAAGILAEFAAHRAVHQKRESIFSYLLLAKAAMLVRQDTTFEGPHVHALSELGRKLFAQFAPIHEFLSGAPVAALPVLTAQYEGAGQFVVLGGEVAKSARNVGVSPDELRTELGAQSIWRNIPGWLQLTVLHDVGQWSITALKFPPTARALNAYVAAYPKVPLEDKLNPNLLRPVPAYRSLVVYPAFLVAGAVTLILAFILVAFLVRPGLGDGGRGRQLMLACFFAATAHVYTLLISAINVSTPRFLMAVYPQIVLAGVFLLLAIIPRLASFADSGPYPVERLHRV